MLIYSICTYLEVCVFENYVKNMENFEIYRKIYPSFATFMEYGFSQLFFPHKYVKINQTDKAFALVKEFEETYQMPFNLLIDMSYLDIYLALKSFSP